MGRLGPDARHGRGRVPARFRLFPRLSALCQDLRAARGGGKGGKEGAPALAVGGSAGRIRRRLLLVGKRLPRLDRQFRFLRPYRRDGRLRRRDARLRVCDAPRSHPRRGVAAAAAKLLPFQEPRQSYPAPHLRAAWGKLGDGRHARHPARRRHRRPERVYDHGFGYRSAGEFGAPLRYRRQRRRRGGV